MGQYAMGPKGSNHGTPLGQRERVPGEMLGEWFHPYDGSAPTHLKHAAQRDRYTVVLDYVQPGRREMGS